MKTNLTFLTILIAAFAGLTAMPAYPLLVQTAGGGCNNCLLGFPNVSCALTCSMPLSTTIENDFASTISVQVALEISFPDGTLCGNAPDSQTVQYVIPSGGSVTLDFGHSFAGAFNDAVFSVTAQVTDSEDPGLIGVTETDSITVGTTWAECGGWRIHIRAVRLE